MTTRGARNTRNFRQRQRGQRLIAMVLMDELAAEERITFKVELLADSLNFVWGGPHDAYRDWEAKCQEHGFSFALVQREVEAAYLDKLLPKLGLKRAGKPKWTPTPEQWAEAKDRVKAKG